MEHVPFYHITLDDKNLQLLGRLAAVWGQTDYVLVTCISKLSGTSIPTVEKLLDGASMGVKLSRFRTLSDSLLIERLKQLAKKIIAKSGAVLGKRNHLIHGVWAMYSLDGSIAFKPACYFPGNKKALIFASELPKIVEQATELLDLLGEFQLLEEEVDHLQGPRNRQLYMGFGPPQGRYEAPDGSYYFDLAELGHQPQ